LGSSKFTRIDIKVIELRLKLEKFFTNISISLITTEYDATIAIGYDPESPPTSFIKAVDTGGMNWEGKESVYDTLENLEVSIKAYLTEMN